MKQKHWSLLHLSFHSISFPNEWGPLWICTMSSLALPVSIQLVSPTSGDTCKEPWVYHINLDVSIQLVSPTSGDEFGLSKFR